MHFGCGRRRHLRRCRRLRRHPDACGICNGPGEIYACGCAGIPAGDCDCDGNQLDALGVCGGTCTADADGDGVCDDSRGARLHEPVCLQLTTPQLPMMTATCESNDAIGDCGGACTSDADGDGICDDVDDCVGTLDACGICNGPVRSTPAVARNPIRRLRLRWQPARRPRRLRRNLRCRFGRRRRMRRCRVQAAQPLPATTTHSHR